MNTSFRTTLAQTALGLLACVAVAMPAVATEVSTQSIAPPTVTLPAEPARIEPLAAEAAPVVTAHAEAPAASSSVSTPTVQHAVGIAPEKSAEPAPGALSSSVPNAPATNTPDAHESSLTLPGGIAVPSELTSPEGLSSTIQMLLMLAVVSLAPAVLMMTTCFVRIVVVLGLLRQSLGGQQMAPNQVITALALFMSLVVMTPVWTKVYHEAVEPYTSHEITLDEAWQLGVKPVRDFMSAQIERTGNIDDIMLFYKYLPEGTKSPAYYDDVPLQVLLPAFVLSELKTAFLIGFQIFLPFVVVDLVVASMTVSMGMMMVPPAMVSMPLKLLLFVLVDGWRLVVGMLLDSFQIVSG